MTDSAVGVRKAIETKSQVEDVMHDDARGVGRPAIRQHLDRHEDLESGDCARDQHEDVRSVEQRQGDMAE